VRLTHFFADETHGGIDGAYGLAGIAEQRLRRRARAMRKV
jgi:hypothetical protein